MKLSIIIPVFNEKSTIAHTLTRVYSVPLTVDREVIVVDDGSTDGTREILSQLQPRYSSLQVILHKSNKGKGTAVQTGFKKASGDIFIVQDADLEYDPRDYRKLLQPILNGKTDVVFGSRFLKYPLTFFGKNRTPLLTHYFGNRFLSLVTNILFGANITDMETGYKVFTRKVYKTLKLSASRFDFEPDITAQILKNGFAIQEVGISFSPRSYKEGKKITWKDGVGALKALLRHRF